MSWVAVAVAGTTAAIKIGTSIDQKNQAKKIKKANVRPINPTYIIPSAEEEALKNSRTIAGRTKLPGQDLMEQQLGASTASGIRASTDASDSSAGLMAAIGGLKGQQMQGQQNIGIQSANYQDMNQQRLQGALAKYGEYQDKAFQYNKIAPFESATNQYNLDYNKEQALEGAGMQNMAGGLDSAAKASAAYGKSGSGSSGDDTEADLPENAPMRANGGLIGKYNSAKRKGFKGNYKDWTSSQTPSLNFNLK